MGDHMVTYAMRRWLQTRLYSRDVDRHFSYLWEQLEATFDFRTFSL